MGRRGRRGLDVVPAPELHGGVRLRQPVARDLLRRSAGARAQVRRHQPLQPAWRGHLGARLRRHAARALPGAQGQVRHRHHPAQDQQRVAQHADHLAQRRRAARHHDDAGQRHRPRQVRLDRPASDGQRDRPRRSHRDDDRPAGGLHVVRLEQRGRRRPERSLPDHDLDRGRLEQSRLDLAGRHGRSAGRRPRAVGRPDVHLAQRRRPIRSHDPQAAGRCAGDRLGTDPRRERRGAAALDVRQRRVGCLDLGWSRQRRSDGRRRPLHVPRVGPRPGRQLEPSRPDGPGRPDDPVADPVALVIHPGCGPEGAPVVRARPAGHA